MPFDGKGYIDPRVGTLRRGRTKIMESWGQGFNAEIPFHKHWWEFWRRPYLFCAATAVGENRDAMLVLLREIEVPFGTVFDLYEWNDAPGRTKAEVLSLYDRAIAGLL
jgi:hypothetical protein